MCLALPGQLLSLAGDTPFLRTGRVRFGELIKEIHLAYVPDARVGDYVIVHAGFALSVLDQEAARRTLEEFAGLASFQISTAKTSSSTQAGT
jgi:hydrogenase expression/formation protein HypC